MFMLCLFYADVMIVLFFLCILIDGIYDIDELPLRQMVLWWRIVQTQEEVYEESEESKQCDCILFSIIDTY